MCFLMVNACPLYAGGLFIRFGMDIGATAEIGLEIPASPDFKTLFAQARRACDAIFCLENALPPPDNRAQPRSISLLEAQAIIAEHNGDLAATPEDIRSLIVTKLILETENRDPRIRLKAYELLGKIDEIGLFAEKKAPPPSETTSEALKDKLRERLLRLKATPEGVYEAETVETE